jgi:ubiquinone/menaquinone biosynthesis C-methylase UbiE
MRTVHTSREENHAHSHDTHGFAHPHRNVEALGITPGMLVADFGAGSGHYVQAIAEALQGEGKVFAVDVQRDLLRRIHNDAVRRHHTNVHIIWGDLERSGASKLADGTVDLVLISNLLFQVEDKQAVLCEALRILKQGGRIAVIDWTDSHGGMGPQKADVITRDAALVLLARVGFVQAQPFAAGAHHWGVIATKPQTA